MTFSPSPSAAARRDLYIFMLFALVLLGAGIGLRDPWPADEPRFALSAKQMVESGNWLIPHRGTEIYADKPPAFMAMQAAFYRVTGSWRVAFLLPSLLAALGTLLLIYDLARRLWDRRIALYAAGALLVTFQFVYQAKRAQIDPSVTFFLTLANYGLLRHFLLGPNWRMYWLGCFAAGLGVITKGVGVLAVLMFAPYIFARFAHWNSIWSERGGIRWLGGPLAFLLALALWLGPMLWAVYSTSSSEMQAYAHDILFRQTAGRYTDPWDHYHPVWYYLGVILTGWLPLVLILPGTLGRWRDAVRAKDARILLPLAWMLLVIFFFSLSRGKRDVYILPALPMFALITAPYLPRLLQARWVRVAALALAVALGIAFAAVGAYAYVEHPAFARELAAQRGLVSGGEALWILLMALGAWALLCAGFFRLRRGVHGLITAIAGLWLLWSFWAYPLLNDSSSAAGVMHRAGALAGPGAQIALVAWKEQNLLLADRPVRDFGFGKPWHTQLADAIRWQEAAPALVATAAIAPVKGSSAVQPARRLVFILGEAMAPCVDQAKSIHVGSANRRDWWLFDHAAVKPECVGGKVPETGVDSADPEAD